MTDYKGLYLNSQYDNLPPIFYVLPLSHNRKGTEQGCQVLWAKISQTHVQAKKSQTL